MSNPTPAQEEFANLFSGKTDAGSRAHPEDRDEDAAYHSSGDEEDRYRASQVDAAMRMPTLDGSAGAGPMKLPPASFDAGRTTGVKGVIADARAYETARRSKWKDRARRARQSVFGFGEVKSHARSSDRDSDGSGSGAEDPDEEAFLEQWRQSRRRELESETVKGGIRNRRTSPSVRIYGRFDEVDALGYLDAIEKVGRETVVAVFVYDHEVSWARRTRWLSTLKLTSATVRGVGHGRVGPTKPRWCTPNRAFCQGTLRRNRVRPCRCPGHSSVPEPRRPIREPDRADRAYPGGRRLH